jgi:3-dehydroquinate dehydratase/shikimate dehydrogenase
MIWRSALKALEDKLGKGSSEERPLDRRNVLVIGAGGTAQAMIHGIHRRKGVVSVTAPADKAAQAIAQRFDVRYVPFASLYDTLADVVILADQRISFGHKKTEINLSYLRPQMTVLDVTQLPDDSPFTTEARQRGCQIVEPADVYIDQLSGQFKAITGKELPKEAYADIIEMGESA